MKQLGLVLKMYANESEGACWPPLALNHAVWAPDIAEISPGILTDPSTWVSKEHPDHEAIAVCLNAILNRPNPDFETAAGLMGLSFAYLHCSVQTAEEFELLVTAREVKLLEGMGSSAVIAVEGRTLFRLREEVLSCFKVPAPSERRGPSLSQSSVPVLVETASWRYRKPGARFRGTDVLFMDGHVEHVPLGTFPVVPEVLDLLCGGAPKPPGGPPA